MKIWRVVGIPPLDMYERDWRGRGWSVPAGRALWHLVPGLAFILTCRGTKANFSPHTLGSDHRKYINKTNSRPRWESYCLYPWKDDTGMTYACFILLTSLILIHCTLCSVMTCFSYLLFSNCKIWQIYHQMSIIFALKDLFVLTWGSCFSRKGEM